jgi:hypothetical protein
MPGGDVKTSKRGPGGDGAAFTTCVTGDELLAPKTVSPP